MFGMRTCKEASRLISQAQDGELGFADQLALRVHLKICDACINFRKQLAFLRLAAQRFPGEEDKG